MALSETLIYFFMMFLGIAMLYLNYKRKEAIAYPFMAFIIFGASILYGGAIPFSVDSAGATVGTTANVVLTGISLLFTFLALIMGFMKGFELFGWKGKKDTF